MLTEMGLILRPGLLDDAVVCAAIEAACFLPSEAASYEKIARRAEAFPQGFLVAELHGEVIGFINSCAGNQPDLSREELKDLVDHDPAGSALVVLSVAVHPDRQGRGYSRPLLTSFIETARHQKRQRILLLCKDYMVAYYLHFGFEDAGPSASTHGGFQWREMRYIL